MKKDNVKRMLCKQPISKPRLFDPSVSAIRQSFIISTDKKWVNGTQIKYFFIEGAEAQRKVVRTAFKKWESLGIGISFKEVATVEGSIVRIGFNLTDGSWSYVGRDILTIPETERTMNFGWDLTDPYGLTTALHEIGHTLGFNHEHQSPFSGIVWNTEAVYTEFSGQPNFWPKEQIDANIINKMPPNQVQGSTWDANSIMEYQFGPGLVKAPIGYKDGIYPPGTISAKDVVGVKLFYPGAAVGKATSITAHKSTAIKSKSGGQDDFVFIAPATKKYTFQTVGELDTVMVIYEKGNPENHYLQGDDDSGLDKNAKITLPLVKGRAYLINIRVMYAANKQSGSIMVY